PAVFKHLPVLCDDANMSPIRFPNPMLLSLSSTWSRSHTPPYPPLSHLDRLKKGCLSSCAWPSITVIHRCSIVPLTASTHWCMTRQRGARLGSNSNACDLV